MCLWDEHKDFTFKDPENYLELKHKAPPSSVFREDQDPRKVLWEKSNRKATNHPTCSKACLDPYTTTQIKQTGTVRAWVLSDIDWLGEGDYDFSKPQGSSSNEAPEKSSGTKRPQPQPDESESASDEDESSDEEPPANSLEDIKPGVYDSDGSPPSSLRRCRTTGRIFRNGFSTSHCSR